MQTSQLQQQWGKFYGASVEAENLKIIRNLGNLKLK
jgi:hypothetical protein